MAKLPYSDPSSIGAINLAKPTQLEAVQDTNEDDVLNPEEIADTGDSPMGLKPANQVIPQRFPLSDKSSYYSDTSGIDMSGYTQDLTFGMKNPGPATSTFTGQFTDSPNNYEDKLTWKGGLQRSDLLDLENKRAQNQTLGTQLAMFTPKLIGKTAVNIFGGTVGIVNGLGNVMRAGIDKDMDGGWHNFYNNDLMERMDEWNKTIDNKLPYYYTKQAREGNFWKRAGASTFWTDQLANGMSFLAGALATELIWTAAAGATGLTGNPAGAAGLVANTQRLMGQAKRMFKGGGKVATVKAGTDLAKTTAAGAAVEATKPTTWQKSMNVLKYPRRFLTGAGYEASIEGHHHYERLKRDLVANYKADKVRNGLAPELTDAEMLKIEEAARSSSNAVWGANLLLVGTGHMLMLPTVYGPGISSIGKFNPLKPKTWNTIGWAEKTAGGATVFKPKWLARKDWLVKNLGMSENAASKLVKSAGVAQAGVGVGIYEGAVEEAGQAYFDHWGYDYTMARSRNTGHKWTKDFVETGVEAMGKTWGDPKSQVEIALGFILGTMGIPGVRAYNQGSVFAAKGRVEALFRDRALAEKLQKFSQQPEFHSMLPSLNAHFKALATSSNIRNMRDDLIESGNFSKAKDLDFDDFFTYVHAKMITGQYEDILHDAEGIKNMSVQDFKNALGYAEDNSLTDKELEDRKNKVAESAISRAEKIRDAIKHVDNMTGTLTEGMDPDSISELKTFLSHIVASAENIDERESGLVNKLAELTGGVVVESEGKSNEGARYRISYKTGEDTTQDYDLGGLSEPSVVEEYKYHQDILKKDDKGQLTTKLSPEERQSIENRVKVLKDYINNQSNDVDLSELSAEEQELLFDKNGHLQNWLSNDLKGTQKLKEVLQIIKDLRRLRSKRHSFINEYNRIVFGGQDAAAEVLRNIRSIKQQEEDFADDTLQGKARDLYRTYGTRATFTVDGNNYKFGDNGQLFRDIIGSSNPTNVSTDPVDPSILDNIQNKDIVTNEMVEAAKALEAIKKLKGFKEKELEKITNSIVKFKKELASKIEDLQKETSKVGQVADTIQDIAGEVTTINNTILELQEAKHSIVEQISMFDSLVDKYYDPELREFKFDKVIGLKNIQNLINDIASNLSLEAGVHRSRLNNIKNRSKEKIDEIVNSIKKLEQDNAPIIESLTEQVQQLSNTKSQLEKLLFNSLRKKTKGLKGINSMQDLFTSEINKLQNRLDKLKSQPELELPEVSLDTQQLLKEFETLKSILKGEEVFEYEDYKQYIKENPNKLSTLKNELTKLQEVESLLESEEFRDEKLDATNEQIQELSEIAEAIKQESDILSQSLKAPIEANQYARFGITIRGILKSLDGIEVPLQQAAENAPINVSSPVAEHESHSSETPNADPVVVDLMELKIPDIVDIGLKKSAANFDSSYKIYMGLSKMVNGKMIPLDGLSDQQLADREGAYLDLIFYDALSDTELSAQIGQGDFVLRTLTARDYKQGNPVYDALKTPIFYSKETENFTANPNDSYHQDPSTADIKLVLYTPDGQLVMHKGYPLLVSMEDGTRAMDENAFTNKHGADRQSIMNEHIAVRNSILQSEEPTTFYIDYLSDPVSLTVDPYTGETLTPQSAQGRAFPSSMQNKDVDLRVATSGSITLDSGLTINVQPGFKYVVYENKMTQLTSSPISLETADQIVNYLKHYSKNLNELRSQGITGKAALTQAGIVEHEGQSYDVMNVLQGIVSYGKRTENHKYGLWSGVQNKQTGFFYKDQVWNEEKNTFESAINFISDVDLTENNLESIRSFKDYLVTRAHNTDNNMVKNSMQGSVNSRVYNSFNIPLLNDNLEVYNVENYDNYKDYLFKTDALMTRAQLPDGGPVAPQTLPRYLVYNEGNVKSQENAVEQATQEILIGEEVSPMAAPIDESNQERLDNLEDEFKDTGLDDIANMTLEMGVSPDLIVEGGVILTQYDDNAEAYVGPADLINVHYQVNQVTGQSLTAFKPGVGLIVKDKVFREVTDPLDISWNRAMAKELEELDLTPTGYNLPGEIAKGNAKIKYISYSVQDLLNAYKGLSPASDPRIDKSISNRYIDIYGKQVGNAHYVALYAEDVNKKDDYIIGAIRVEFDSAKNASVGKSSIAPGLIGRGIGQNLYLLANNILQEKYNQVLQSDSTGTTSMDATYAWESLTRRGFAESIDVSTYSRMPRWSMKRSIPEGRPTQEIEAEIAKAQKMLPKNQIEIVSGFIGDSNNRVVGQVRGFGKTLVSNLGLGGEVYHETFHQASMFILSNEESNSIYDEFRSLEGDVRTYKGKKKKFNELTNKEADEYAAEEFRHWVLSEGNYKSDLYGTFKKKPKTLLGRIFTKIKAVLQGLLGLNNNMQPTAEMQKTAELFQNIESGYYAESKPSLERDQGSVANMARLPQLSDNRSTEATELITNYFSNILFFDKGSSLNITDLSTDKITTQQKVDFTKRVNHAYNRTFLLLERDLRRRLTRAAIQEDVNAVAQTQQDINYFKENKDEIINIHKQWLSNLGLSFTVEYNEQLAERNQSKDSLGIFSGYRANEFSSVTGANPMLKFLIGTLPNSGNRNTFGLIGSKDYHESMGFLHSKLQGIMDPAEQRAALESLKPTNVWIKELLRRLGSFESKDLRDVTLQTSFYQQFSQSQTNAYTNVLRDQSSDSMLVEANKSGKVQSVKNKWVNNLRLDKSGFVKTDSNNNLILDLNKALPYTMREGTRNMSINSFKKNNKNVQNMPAGQALEFLNHLGIKFSNPQDIISTNLKEVKEAIEYILKNIKNDNIADMFDAQLNVQGRLNKLIEAEIENSTDLSELMYQTPSGTRKYSISQNTFFHHVANQINNGVLPDHLDPANNPYTTNSISVKLLKDWLALSADKRLTTPQPKIEVAHLIGMSVDERSYAGKDWSFMNVSERLLFTIENTLKGKTVGFRTADAKTQYIYSFPKIGSYLKLKDAETELLGYLDDEITSSARRNKEGFGSDIAVYRDQAQDLRIFKGILKSTKMSDVLREDLNKAIKGQHLVDRGSDNSILVKHKDEVLALIDTHLSEESKNVINNMMTNKIVSLNETQGVYTINGLSPSVIQKFAGSNVISRNLKGQKYFDKINKAQMENIAYAYVLNEFIGDNEQFKVFFGDPAQYTKNDVFKKFKGAAAFKTLARNDNAINKQLNDISNRRLDNKIEDGTFNLKVFADPISESMMSDLYETVLGNEAAPYRDMKEADGQILASLHHYRSLMYRTTGFSPAQEQMYQRLYNKDLETPSRQELLAAFPIIKPQYWGPQIVSGRPNLMAFLKMSLAPLIPNVINDKPNLTALAANMEETGTDGVLFPSGFKMGYKVNSDGTLDSFYRSGDVFDGDITMKGSVRPIEPGSYNTLDIGYMGIQLEVSPDEKATATKGVQPTTLILSNIYEDGQISNKELQSAAQEYIDLQNDLTRQKFRQVLKDLNIERNKDGSFKFAGQDMQNVIKHLKDQMVLSKFSENAIAGVEQVLSNPNELNRVFDILPNSNDIESLLFSIVSNNVIKQKFKGDLKVLQSPTGYEQGMRILKANNKLVAGYFNEDGLAVPTLRSYSWDTNDLSKQTMSAEVYLPHYFSEYFEEDLNITRYGIYDDQGQLISEDAGLLDLIAYRIPTGGLNLIDSFVVKGFLPKNAGPVMVAPAELTIKESLDFDIDKQTIYFKSYRKTLDGKLVERKYITADEINAETLGLIYDEKYGPTLEFFKQLDRSLAESARYKDDVPYNPAVENIIKAIFGERSLDYSEAEIEILVDTFRSLDKDAMKLQLGETIGDEQYSRSREEYAVKQYEEIKERIKKIPSKEDFMKDVVNNELSYAEVNHPGAVQNRIMELMKYILLHNSNRAELLRPTGPESIIEMGDYFTPEQKAEEKTWTEIMSPKNKLTILDRFIGSKNGLGIAATNNTHIIKSQIANLRVRRPIESIRFAQYQEVNHYPYLEQNDGTVSIAKKYDLDMNLITTQSNIVLNALADAVKNPAIFHLGITEETLGVAYYLMRLGVPLGTTIAFEDSNSSLDYANEEEWRRDGGHIENPSIPLFLSQPIIKEYLEEISINNSSHTDNKPGLKLSNKQIETAIRKRFMPSKAKIKDTKHLYNYLNVVRNQEAKSITGVYETGAYIGNGFDQLITYYTVEDLQEMFDNDGGRLDKSDTTLLMQQNILTDFLEYKNVGDKLMNLTKASAFDTLRPRNRQESRFLVSRIKRSVSDPLFANASDLINKTHLKELTRVIGYSAEMFSQFFLTDSPNVRKMSGLDNLVERYSDPALKLSEKDISKILTRAQNDLVASALNANISKDIEFEGQIFKQTLYDRAESLLIGNKSLPYLIGNELAENPNNVLLQGLIPMLKINANEPNGLKFYTKALDVYKQNVLAESFMELSDELQDKLIEFAILQSGLNSTDMSFLKILPSERYIDKALSIVPAFNNITNTVSQNPDWITNFETNFYRNNWENKLIVPRINTFNFNEIRRGESLKYDNLSFFNYRKDLIGVFDNSSSSTNKNVIKFLPLGDGKFFLEYPTVGSKSILPKNRLKSLEATDKGPLRDEPMNNNDEKAQIDKQLEEECE